MHEPAIKSKPARTGAFASVVTAPQFMGVLLVVMTVLAYQPVWHAGFIWDDDSHLTANPCIIGPSGFKGIWTTSAATYYPLVLTTFWVEHALWGLHPLPYHLVNVAMHAACALLFWWILRSLRVRGAWFGAALWALHPVQVESVAWITELKNTQSCCFYLLAILFFLKWRSAAVFANRKGTEWDYGLAWLCGVLAILSKSSTVMLPVALGLLWWWTEGRWQWRNAIRLAPFFLVSAAAGIWTIWEQQFHSGAVGAEWAQSGLERLEVAGATVWFYLGKLLWPHPLIFIYPRWEMKASDLGAYVPAAALVVALLVFWLKRGSRMRPVFICFTYFVISLFPVMDFFKVYFFHFTFVGDHFQYLASLGPLALAGAGIAAAMGRIRKPFINRMLCGALLLTLGTLTWRQSRMYASEETLWRTTLRRNPQSWLAWNNLGVIVESEGRSKEAMSQYQEAIRLKPDYAPAHYNLGLALARRGQIDEAISQYREAIRLKSDYAPAHDNLGRVLGARGQIEEAIREYREAIRLKPDNAATYYNLGTALGKNGQIDEAISQFQEAIRLQPDYAEAYNNLGTALGLKGQPGQAISQFREAIRLKPDYADARNNLARALKLKDAPAGR